MKRRQKKTLLPLLLLASGLLLAIYGCVTDVIVTTGSIVGAVTDAKSGENISGVNVTLSPSGRSFTTSADGRYEFRDIEQGSYTVQASKAGYTQTQKNVEVIAGETSSLDLTLRASAPVLELSTSTLDFGNTATTLTLDIKNTGSAELTWQISEDITWLSCLPTSGTTGADKSSSVILSVDRNNLTRGNYNQTIAIASNGGSQTVKVTMGVQGVTVEASPETLDFGSTTTSLTLTLRNTDDNPSLISYTLSPSNDWIILSKTSGQFTYSDNVTVSVDRTQLSAGDYSGTLTLTVEGQTKEIPVKMTIAAKSKPTVSMTSVEGVTFNSATLRGAIASVGSSQVVHHGFVWSAAEQPTLETAEKCDLGNTQTAKDFTYNATSLLPSTTYYVRAYAENDEGVAYSDQQRFTTREYVTPPTVETGSATDIQQQQAIVTGTLVATGTSAGVTAYGHVWSTRQNPTTSDNKTDFGATTQIGDFTSTLTGLDYNTTYYVRAYATNDGGTSYGKEITFTTKPDMITKGLLGYYTFDNETADNIYKDENHGFAVGGTFTGDTPNGIGKALSLKGEEYMSIGSNLIEGKDNWSISMWVKDFGTGPLLSTNKTSNDIGIPSFGIGENGCFTVKMPSPELYYAEGSCKVMVSLTNYQQGKWTHVALVGKTTSGTSTQYEGTFALYVNGRKVDSVVYYGRLTGNGSSMIFGGKSTSYTGSTGIYRYMVQTPDPMIVDNIRIHSSALSDDEVKQIYEYEK